MLSATLYADNEGYSATICGQNRRWRREATTTAAGG